MHVTNSIATNLHFTMMHDKTLKINYTVLSIAHTKTDIMKLHLILNIC